MNIRAIGEVEAVIESHKVGGKQFCARGNLPQNPRLPKSNRSFELALAGVEG
jgi:hypothetical protein